MRHRTGRTLTGIVAVTVLLAGCERADEPDVGSRAARPGERPRVPSVAPTTVRESFGSVTWTHTADLDAPVPGTWNLVRTPTGFAAFESHEPTPFQAGSVYWTSPDGVSWTEERFPLPFDPSVAHARRLAGRYWLTTFDPTALWVSEDFETWSEVDLSGWRPPPSTGLVWRTDLDEIAGLDDIALVSFSVSPELPLRRIFGGSGPELSLWEDEVIRGDEVIARIRYEAVEGGVAIIDADTGVQLHRFSSQLPGQDGNDLLSAFTGPGPSWDLIAVVDPDRTVTVIEPPWSRWAGRTSSSEDTTGTSLVAADGRFLMYVTTDRREPGDHMRTDAWASDDGRSWTNLGRVELPHQGSLAFVDIFELSGYLFADVATSRPHREMRLISTDGLTWEPFVPDAPVSAFDALPFGEGYIALGSGAEGLWASADGVAWERIEAPEGLWKAKATVVAGDRVFFVGTDEMWILERQRERSHDRED